MLCWWRSTVSGVRCNQIATYEFESGLAYCEDHAGRVSTFRKWLLALCADSDKFQLGGIKEKIVAQALRDRASTSRAHSGILSPSFFQRARRNKRSSYRRFALGSTRLKHFHPGVITWRASRNAYATWDAFNWKSSFQFSYALGLAHTLSDVHSCALRRQERGCSQVRLQQKQHSVGRNVQVEIDQAVQQESAYGGNRRRVNRPRKMPLLGGETLFRIAE